jgi:hypothetical protein
VLSFCIERRPETGKAVVFIVRVSGATSPGSSKGTTGRCV